MQSLPGVVCPHQMFAHENDAYALAIQSRDVLRGFDPGFTDEDGRFIDEIDETEGVADIGLHGAQVSIVDTEEAIGRVWEPDMRPNTQQVFHVVDFDERGQLELLRQDEQVNED